METDDGRKWLISNETSEIGKDRKIRKKREECTKEKVMEEWERHLNTTIFGKKKKHIYNINKSLQLHCNYGSTV
jgi:hypothetical protein